MDNMTQAHHARRPPELDLFRLYLDQVGRHPLLTAQDEVELAQAYEVGLQAQRKLADATPGDPARPELEATAERGEQARRKMIESNLRLVVSIARHSPATGLPLGDLVQEGNLGCCGRWRSSTGARGSSSPPTPPGGSARPSPAGRPTAGPGHPPPGARGREGGAAAAHPGPPV
jgi:hypothetical protein